MRVLVCVKRVPATGGQIALTADQRDIDARFLGFTVSPHEECAVEEAVRIVEAQGGTSAVLTLGPESAADQLRDAMAIGIDQAILLETDGSDWDPGATAGAIVDAIRDLEASDGPFDLILFGNESADSGGFQVGIRVAHALGRAMVNGGKGLSIEDGLAHVQRESDAGRETYELPLPAVVGVKEGINLPRYPTMKGRLASKKADVLSIAPEGEEGGLHKVSLRRPVEKRSETIILGTGPEAAPAVVDVLAEIGVL